MRQIIAKIVAPTRKCAKNAKKDIKASTVFALSKAIALGENTPWPQVCATPAIPPAPTATGLQTKIAISVQRATTSWGVFARNALKTAKPAL